ncbi:MAG: hypothetical protein OT477_09865 [Chloroflexi bacterium]|nr:hypothetical protein [Chloroflexota bacterium]
MSGGYHALAGLEYQFHMSAWLTLLAHKVGNFNQIEIETTFGQDAELLVAHSSTTSDIDNIDAEMNFTHQAGDCSVQIQVKTRQRHREWTIFDIKQVLLKVNEGHSASQQITALEKLAQSPQEIFLFVTNGKVNQQLTPLLCKDISEFIQNPNRQNREQTNSFEKLLRQLLESKTGLPKDLLTLEVLKRIYIYEAPRYEDIKEKIELVLEREYRIQPYTRAQEVLAKFVERIRQAALGNNPTINTEEITQSIGNRGAQPPYLTVSTTFQENDAYQKAVGILEAHSIVLLVGEPCVGKTTIGKGLVNKFYSQGYDQRNIKELSQIYEALHSGQATILLMDDPFGDINFRDDAMNLANSLGDLINELKDRQGNIKLILTIRRNIFADLLHKAPLLPSLENYKVDVSKPTRIFQRKVLRSWLNYFSAHEQEEFILNYIESSESTFEDLLHIHHLAKQISTAFQPNSEPDISYIFDQARPSKYQLWIDRQSASIKLLFLTLWLIKEVNPVAQEEDLKRIYETIQNIGVCTEILGEGFKFRLARKALKQMERIEIDNSNSWDFIHPELRLATKKYFTENADDFSDLACAIVQSLHPIEHPIEQSIAAMLSTAYYSKIKLSAEKLSAILKLPFLQARDTIIQFGAHLLKNKETEQIMTEFYEKKYTPDTCEVDNNGNLIVKKEKEFEATPLGDIVDALIKSLYIDDEANKYTIEFEAIISSGKPLWKIDPITKYYFAIWLTQSVSTLDKVMIVKYLDELSLDYTSFVRNIVAKRLGEVEGVQHYALNSIFKRLCYDKSPHVKIAILEHFVIPLWANWSPEEQDEALNYVVHMLEDPVFRNHCARGLLNQSGTRYFYHDHHTDKQVQVWFEKVGIKLLDFEFSRWIRLNDLLATFDKHLEDFSPSFRVPFLEKLLFFISQNPYFSEDTTITINKMVLSSSTTLQEHDLLLKLINCLPSTEKARLLFDFLQEYSHLSDDRYKEFVHRPFYIENSDEFVSERAAVILGYLNNPEIIAEDLYQQIAILGSNAESAVEQYVKMQNDDFKYILLAYVFGDDTIRALYGATSLHSHPIVKQTINYFLQDSKLSNQKIFVTDMLLVHAYSLVSSISESGIPKDVWLSYLENLLSLEDPLLGKVICDIFFDSNIRLNVHNIQDWSYVLRRLVTHSNFVVQSYAINLFDIYFHSILEDILAVTLSSLRTEILEMWFSETAIREFQGKSKFFDLFYFLILTSENWKFLSESEQANRLEKCYEFAITPDFQYKKLVFDFVLKYMGDKLHDSQSERLYRAIFGVNAGQRNEYNIPFKDIYDAKVLELDNRVPKFDWSKYGQRH